MYTVWHIDKYKKNRIALIMLIIALQFDVSTSCNEKIEITKMNKNCTVCVYTVSLSQLRNHYFPVAVVT